jgi:hypothetical protein
MKSGFLKPGQPYKMKAKKSKKKPGGYPFAENRNSAPGIKDLGG